VTAPADRHAEIREGVRALCAEFPPAYFRAIDAERGYPEKFVDALTRAGWLAALIPQEYGGSGLGVTEASVIMEEINRAGGNAGACHGQMYNMGTLVRHGSAEQKARYLPKIARGELRLQSMGVTEPGAGTDTTALKTFAKKKGDRYVVNGQKVWTSRALHSDLMLLLARTTPIEQVKKRSEGLSVFLVDIRESRGKGMDIRPLKAMVNHNTTEIFFDNLEIPAENLIGEEGQGLRYIMDGMNAERILVASEAVGDGRWFLNKAVDYANSRVVFGRSIGKNQGVQFPLARAYAELEAADMMCRRAAALFGANVPCGADANMAKLLASEACWKTAEAAMQTHGGFSYAKEYDIERKWREVRLYQIAPISTNLVLAYLGQHVLGMERSY
jgi:acyl-CoA dehydrogenase